ncbi:MAG TPA: DUF1080 domain-containing protein [Puia sp.]|nr:DUF1080 domain-containing protein [Puia sp.]
MLRRNYFLLLPFIIIGLAAFNAGPTPEKREWVSLFNGKDLSGWDTYLGLPTDSSGSQQGEEPLGLNNDPQHVFTVVKDGREKVIRISGQEVGALTSRKEFGNYHLQLLFRWGKFSWGNKKGKKKDSGLLYHSVGPYGADYGAWMRSHEFQIQEGDCGDYWGCAGAIAAVPAVKLTDSEYVYDPAGALYAFRADNNIGRHCIKGSDAERPSGEWNTLDLYCHGDTSVHVVNGKVMMVLYRLGQVRLGGIEHTQLTLPGVESGQEELGQVAALTKGKLQLQSEGAEVYYKRIRIQGIERIPAELIGQGRPGK